MAEKNPLICAVDTQDVRHATELVGSLQGSIGYAKLGLEFFTANGAQGLAQVRATNTPIFLDLKFHDIPNTVAGAVRSAAQLGVGMLTLHAGGGKRMLEAAVQAAKEESEASGVEKPMLLGVTVLTSMDESDLREVGVDGAVKEQVLRLANVALDSGLEGIVCSAHELVHIKERFGDALKCIVPGIRPAGADKGDQRRVLSPKEAVDLGADYIVVGRPITQSEAPQRAAQEIVSSL